MNVYAISLLPLGLLTILQNTQAFWTAILAYCINKEAFHKIEGIGIIACFAGVLMIALSGKQHEEDITESRFETAEEDKVHGVEIFGGSENTMRIIGIVTMLFVAFNDASLNVLARTMKDLHYSLIQFWFSAIGLVFLFIYLIVSCAIKQDWPDMIYYSGEQMVYVTLTGVFSALNLTCLVIAYQNDGSATVSLLAYIALVYAFVADVTIFQLTFVAMELLGAFVITFFNVFTIVYKIKYGESEDEAAGAKEGDNQVKEEEESADEKTPCNAQISGEIPRTELENEWEKAN